MKRALSSLLLSFLIMPLLSTLLGASLVPYPSVVDLQGRMLAASPNKQVPLRGSLHAIKQVELPVLELYKTAGIPSKGTILLFPGGGYQLLAVEHEGTKVAEFLNAQGYDVAILEYSIATADARDKALSEAIQAADLLRKHGIEFGLNVTSLGVMGFSAGGHLVARLVHEEGSVHRFAQIILIYPAYLEASEGSPGLEGLNQEVMPPKGIPSRVFVLIGDQDQPEWIASARVYAKTAQSNGQEAEFHLLPGIAHGFGIQHGLEGEASGWTEFLGRFLSREGR